MSHPADLIELDLPASLRYLNLLGACIAEALVRVDYLTNRTEITHNIQLAAQEICTNIVQHAYHGQYGRIRCVLAVQPRGLQLDIFDTGDPFDIDKIPPPNLDDPQGHGLGLYLMRQLMDEVIYHRDSDQNHWRLVKTW
jgi:serine/threonine-protein kinase RsbW